MKELYPTLAARLADLAARIDANDRETERINTRARPVGAEWLAGAERIARGLKGFNDGTADVPRITRDLACRVSSTIGMIRTRGRVPREFRCSLAPWVDAPTFCLGQAQIAEVQKLAREWKPTTQPLSR